MGAGGSIAKLQSIKTQLEKLPESCDAAKAKELLGSNFDPKVFDQLKANETVERSKLIAYYENLYKSATAATTSPATTADATASTSDVTAANGSAAAADPVDETPMSAGTAASKYAPDTTAVDYKALHSIVRWNKPAKMDELKKLLATDTGAVVRAMHTKYLEYIVINMFCEVFCANDTVYQKILDLTVFCVDGM